MQMIQFTDIEDLNKFLAEEEETRALFIKSVKTVVINDKPNFFVLIDKNTHGYCPKTY